MRIDQIQLPVIDGVPPEEALRRLLDHCRQTAELLMDVNNRLEELQRKVQKLDQPLRYT
jgi:hypothetical protein